MHGTVGMRPRVPQSLPIREYTISLIVTQFQRAAPQVRGSIPTVRSGLGALCIRLESDSDLQPIRIKEPDNWWSPFVAAFIILIMSGWRSHQHAYVCNKCFIVFVNWTVEGELNVGV